MLSGGITESRVQMLTTQKPIHFFSFWWKVKYCFISAFGVVGRVDFCPKGNSPLLTISGQEILQREGNIKK